MPLNRGTDSFITGGIQGILLFEALFAGIEEDIPNDFNEGKLRSRFDFHDVEILDTEEAVSLDDGSFRFYVGQSNRKSSANARLITDWDAYAQKINKDGVVPDVFEGERRIFGRVQIEYGKDVNPSNIWVPVGEPGDDIEKLKKGAKTAAKKGSDIETLYALIVGAADAGVTAEDVKKTISSSDADTRKLVSKGGGLPKVLEALVETKRLSLEDGVYTSV